MAYMCRHGSSECDGCGRCREENSVYCPVCGEEVGEYLVKANDGEVLGCDNCVTLKNVEDIELEE